MVALAAGFWPGAARARSGSPHADAALPSATPAPAADDRADAPDGHAGGGTAAKASELPKCADCHADQVKAFARNPHARYSHKGKKPDPEEVCSTCHGDGTKHIEGGGDAA